MLGEDSGAHLRGGGEQNLTGAGDAAAARACAARAMAWGRRQDGGEGGSVLGIQQGEPGLRVWGCSRRACRGLWWPSPRGTPRLTALLLWSCLLNPP